ncbi:uncharacterized protein LOC119777935 [Cyprinodon tularosa]|uniref:uncharacterized protein LOC119777935 n=1 Tax=Cyprinodon tularosa TaxID=77115 RepID=UPI0018E254B2|nr:uncharacterized protein LOC119777935 [Cyprinodon tularosa]
MNAIIGLQLMLIGICGAVEPSCNGRQDKAQYYRALGENMELSLVKSISQISRFQLTKNNSVILRWRKNNTVFSLKESRFLFLPSDGTFRIDDLKTGDSGEYRLEIFDASGKETGNRTLHLCVQAPVSSVQLVHQCLSPGQIKVSCLSEGDSPQYNWTLDGKTLKDSELLSGNYQTSIIVVRQNISGRLVCSVRNQVSSSSNYFKISDSGFKINCTSNRTQTDILVDKVNNTQDVEVTTVYPTIKHTTMG